MEKVLNQLVAKLKRDCGANLKAVLLYGSAAKGEFHPGHSDLNVLCVFDRLDALELAKLNRTATWWTRQGHPPPLVLTLAELQRCADVFAIELLDIKSNHRVLYGEGLVGSIEVPLTLHRAQVKRELRTNLIRLRQQFLLIGADPKGVLRLMTQSVSTFIALFRHALMALGEPCPRPNREVVDRWETLAHFDHAAFRLVLDVREGKRRERGVDVTPAFGTYLEAVGRVAEEIDRRFATLPP